MSCIGSVYITDFYLSGNFGGAILSTALLVAQVSVYLTTYTTHTRVSGRKHTSESNHRDGPTGHNNYSNHTMDNKIILIARCGSALIKV